VAAACAVVIPIQAIAQTAAPAAKIDGEAAEALAQVQVSGKARRHRLDADEAKKVAGTYAMSNGWTLRVTPRVRQIHIQINDGPPIPLIAQSGDKFASADGNIATVFNLGPWQEDVVMSYVPTGALASERLVIGSAAALASR
jgi:hypothetical protein